jgi:hypothetical protein
MSILVRNEEHVSECLLLNGEYLPREEILNHPQVKKLIGNRSILHFSMYHPQQGVVMVDLDLGKPQA